MIHAVGVKVGIAALLAMGAVGGSAWLISNRQPTNLGEKLSKENYSLLNVEKDSSVDKEKWEEIVKKYEEQDNYNKIEELNLTAPADNGTDRTENINKLKEKCKNLFEATIRNDEEFSKKEKLAKNWCVSGAEGKKETLQ